MKLLIKVLAYFSNPSNTVDLSEPLSFHDREQPVQSFGLGSVRDQLEDAWEEPKAWGNTGLDDSSYEPPLPGPTPDDSEPFYEQDAWREDTWEDDVDPPDQPPPPTIRRRPWRPQSPSPLSATDLPDLFDPPIP